MRRGFDNNDNWRDRSRKSKILMNSSHSSWSSKKLSSSNSSRVMWQPCSWSRTRSMALSKTSLNRLYNSSPQQLVRWSSTRWPTKSRTRTTRFQMKSKRRRLPPAVLEVELAKSQPRLLNCNWKAQVSRRRTTWFWQLISLLLCPTVQLTISVHQQSIQQQVSSIIWPVLMRQQLNNKGRPSSRQTTTPNKMTNSN